MSELEKAEIELQQQALKMSQQIDKELRSIRKGLFILAIPVTFLLAYAVFELLVIIHMF